MISNETTTYTTEKIEELSFFAGHNISEYPSIEEITYNLNEIIRRINFIREKGEIQ